MACYSILTALKDDNTTVHPARGARTGTGRVAVLEVVAGAERGRTYELSRPQMIVGKGDVDIRLSDTGVSRNHAKVVRAADGGISIIDLASTNGTLVNDAQVDMAILRDGDRIRLGPDAVLRLRLRVPADKVRQVGPPADADLSARQLEVARLVARGLTNADVAEQLEISPRTVASHLDHIYGRLGIGSRAALTRWVIQSGQFEER